MPACIDSNHQVKVQILAAVFSERNAYKTAGMGGHEIDFLRCDKLGGGNKITLIFAILIINDNDYIPFPDLLNRLINSAGRVGFIL
jgi:hypothetical protein